MELNDEIETLFNELCDEYQTNVFMSPYLYHGEYYWIDTDMGNYLIPTDIESDKDNLLQYTEANEIYSIETITGYYARCSANGYMDCTDYDPINDTEDIESFFDMYYSPNEYTVIVGNIGNVFESYDKTEALEKFNFYVEDSKTGLGRSGNEPVTLMENDEPIKDYTPEEE